LPDDKHRVKFSRKNPNVSFINQDDELNDLEMGNAEDHDYTPSKGYRPLSQREAELVGFHNLNVDIPDDIYDRISNVRQRMARVGAGAGRLTRVKEQVVAEDEIDEMAAAGNFGNRIWYHGTSNRAFNKILQSGVVKPFLADAEEPGEAIWLTSDPNEALEYGKIVLAIPNSIVRNFKVERWSGFPHGFIKKYGGKPVNYNMVIKDSVPLKYWKMLDPKTGNLVNIPKVKTKEGVAEGTIDEAKKRKRKRNHSRKSITTGWWGGYWGDGSEGGDGGGVEESTQDAAKDQQEFAIHLSNLPRYFKTTDPLAQLVPERDTHTFAVHSDILRDDERAIPWRRTFAALTGKDYSRRVFAGYRPKKMPITSNTLIADMMYADFYYSRTVYKTPDEKNLVAQKYIDSMKLLNNADISSYKKPELLIPK
jgi:hypothetical protein